MVLLSWMSTTQLPARTANENIVKLKRGTGELGQAELVWGFCSPFRFPAEASAANVQAFPHCTHSTLLFEPRNNHKQSWSQGAGLGSRQNSCASPAVAAHVQTPVELPSSGDSAPSLVSILKLTANSFLLPETNARGHAQPPESSFSCVRAHSSQRQKALLAGM